MCEHGAQEKLRQSVIPVSETTRRNVLVKTENSGLTQTGSSSSIDIYNVMDIHPSWKGSKVTMDSPRWIQNEIMSLKGISPACFWFLCVGGKPKAAFCFYCVWWTGRDVRRGQQQQRHRISFQLHPFFISHILERLGKKQLSLSERIPYEWGARVPLEQELVGWNSSMANSMSPCVSLCKQCRRGETQH